MSTNSLLASLHGGKGSSYSSTTTRSSSLFTKQYSFMANKQVTDDQRTRPSSVSKIIENSSPNELMKWTPLIKTVHKLTAKIKKDYFFFWCRMEAYIKSKNKLKPLDKQNMKQMSNTNMNANTDQIDKIGGEKQMNQPKPIEKIPICENNTLLNILNSDKVKVIDNPITIENVTLSIVETKKIQTSTGLNLQQQPSKGVEEKQHLIFTQTNNVSADQLNQDKQMDKISQTPKQQEMKSQRDIQLSNFAITLSKLHYKFSSKAILFCFLSLKKFSIKIFSVRKLCAIQFYQSKKLKICQVFRILKKNSHQIMKSQILTNSLNTWINKIKLSTVKFIYQKLQKQRRQEQNLIKECNIKKEIQETKEQKVSLSFQRFSFAKQNQIVQQTPRFTIECDKTIEELHIESVADFSDITKGRQFEIKDKQLQKTQLIISPSLNISKKVTLFSINSSFKQQPAAIKEDTPLLNYELSSKTNHQRMKRLNRLYPQQPFLQLPDISQITLFDTVIKNNSMLFIKKRQQNKSMNTSAISSINLCMDRDKSISCHSTISKTKPDFPISPRFDQHISEEMKYTEELFKKSSSCANIAAVQKVSSASNLKTNPNTPGGSAKKIIGLFSKKNSVELYSRDAVHSNFQSKLQTTKSAVLKKFDLFAELKTQQPKHKQKVLLSNSKEYKNESNKKGEKQKVYESKNSIPLNFSQSKFNQDSNKKLQQKNNSSKVVEKMYDMSAKRIGTGTKKQISSSKKQNQPRNLNQKSANKKIINRNDSCKQNQLSQFNTLSKKVISYEEFMKNFPNQKISSTRTPLKEVFENEPNFNGIHMTDQDLSSKNLSDCYGLFSAQLPKTKNENTQQKSKKLRSKIEKIEVNTARKMKMQIENMINQRKKNSIGILKF